MAKVEPTSLTWLMNFIKPYAVRVTSSDGGEHVPGSYHYAHRALDVAGPAPVMRNLAAAALKRHSSFVEVFHDPMGRYVKNGTIRQGSIGGHVDHVHLAR